MATLMPQTRAFNIPKQTPDIPEHRKEVGQRKGWWTDTWRPDVSE
jgi:hypothetical protein